MIMSFLSNTLIGKRSDQFSLNCKRFFEVQMTIGVWNSKIEQYWKQKELLEKGQEKRL